ncbi:hypothetical protein ACXYUI_28550, partial [Klebsiella pneumoniae]
GGSGDFGVITDLTLRYAIIADGIAYAINARNDHQGAFRDFFQAWTSACKTSLDPATSSKLQMYAKGGLQVIGVTRQGSGDLSTLQALAS